MSASSSSLLPAPIRVLASADQRLAVIREVRLELISLAATNERTQQAAFRAVAASSSMTDSLRARVHQEMDRIRECEIELLDLEMAEPEDCIIVDGRVVVDRRHRGLPLQEPPSSPVSDAPSASFDKYITTYEFTTHLGDGTSTKRIYTKAENAAQ